MQSYLGQWDNEHALGVVASAHLRPPSSSSDSPVLDMPLLPGSCPHSPFPHPVTAVTLPGGPGPSAGECWKASPNLPGLQSFKTVLSPDFVSEFSWFFFFYCWLLIKKSQSMFMALWASLPKITCSVLVATLLLDEGNYCSDPGDPLLPWVNWRKWNINL